MIIERMTDIFREIFANEDIELTQTTGTHEIEEWDSLSHVLLVEAIEREFGIEFELDEVFNVKNVGDFEQLIKKNLIQED